MPELQVHHFGGYLKMGYNKLFTHVESCASTVSLLESGEQRYRKAIIIINCCSSNITVEADIMFADFVFICRILVMRLQMITKKTGDKQHRNCCSSNTMVEADIMFAKPIFICRILVMRPQMTITTKKICITPHLSHEEGIQSALQ